MLNERLFLKSEIHSYKNNKWHLADYVYAELFQFINFLVFCWRGFTSNWAVFFVVFRLYTFLLSTFCLRFAYALAVSACAGVLCFHLPTRVYAYLISRSGWSFRIFLIEEMTGR